jgi:Holliday junction resolvasome RuvABC endonuclease subunit
VILGIDPGLANTGWALVSRGGDVEDCGCLHSKRDKEATGDEQRRLIELTQLLVPLVGRAQVVVVEWPPPIFPQAGRPQLAIAGAQTKAVAALVFGLAAAHHRPITAPAAVTWRAGLGHARGKDEQLHAELRVKYSAALALARVRAGDEPHVLDAIGLALYRVALADRAREAKDRASRQLALPT